jgi:hypothetical protein
MGRWCCLRLDSRREQSSRFRTGLLSRQLKAVSCGSARDDLRELHKLGVEFVDDAPAFWGAVYEELLALAVQRDPRD